MRADFHMHTDFSYDSQAPVEAMIQEALQRGLQTICITDHHDLDFVEPAETDFERYFPTLRMLQEKYRNQIEILIGLEFGMQPHLGQVCTELAETYPYDFIIGSSHLVNGIDPYYPEYYTDKNEYQAYEQYFLGGVLPARRCSSFIILRTIFSDRRIPLFFNTA